MSSSTQELLVLQCDLTMLIELGVLLNIMKCVTPRGPAMATKSFRTFFFLTWLKKGTNRSGIVDMEQHCMGNMLSY